MFKSLAATILIALSAPSAFAATPVALGIAVLNQDPTIDRLPQLILREPLAEVRDSNPGYAGQFETIRARMHTRVGTSLAASQDEVYAAAVKLLPSVLANLKARGLIAKAKEVGALYGLDPLHILAPIVVEGIYNASTLNQVEDFAGFVLQVTNHREFASEWIDNPQVAHCAKLPNVYVRWNCVIEKWGAQVFTMGGNFTGGFTAKTLLGRSYGIAQFGPVRAIMLTDILQRVSKFPPMNDTDVGPGFGLVLDPSKTVHAIAANAVMVIAAYRRTAGFDLTKRPDLTATLYNTGFEVTRANDLVARMQTAPASQPQNNYFGYFIRANRAALYAALGTALK